MKNMSAIIMSIVIVILTSWSSYITIAKYQQHEKWKELTDRAIKQAQIAVREAQKAQALAETLLKNEQKLLNSLEQCAGSLEDCSTKLQKRY